MPGFAAALAEGVSDLQQRRGAGRIVVGAVVDLAGRIGRHGVPSAEAEVVVMGANHHGFSCERRIRPCNGAHDVADLAADLREALDGVDAHAGQRTGPRLEVPVNRARGGLQVEAGAECLLQLRAFDPQHRYPVVIGLRVAQPAAVVGGVGLV